MPAFPVLAPLASIPTQGELDAAAASWITAAEEQVAVAAALPLADQAKYAGRAEGPQYKLAPALGPPGRPWKKTNSRVLASLNLAALLTELCRARRAQPSGPPSEWCRSLLARIGKKKCSWVRDGLPHQWKSRLRNLFHLDPQTWQTWAIALRAAAADEIKELEADSEAKWRQWAQEACKGNAAAGHRWSKAPMAWRPDAHGVGPDSVLEEWAPLWGVGRPAAEAPFQGPEFTVNKGMGRQMCTHHLVAF